MTEYADDKELREIEEEIEDDEGTATLGTRFNIFRRDFKNFVLTFRILLGLLVLNGIAQTVFVVLIFLKMFFPWIFN
ncbi:MAG: hypothetical protein ACTSO7_07780 [Candidatus Heimdallarchaeota archaeon]